MQGHIAANLDKAKALALGRKALPERALKYQAFWNVVCAEYVASLAYEDEKIRQRVEHRIVWLFMNIMAKLKGVEMARLVPYTWEDEADWLDL